MSTETATSYQSDEDDVQQDDAVIVAALRRSLIFFAVAAVVGGGVLYWITRPEQEELTGESKLAAVEVRQLPTVQPPKVAFKDVTESVGIQFVHNNGATGEKLLPETMGGGCAFLDFDNDGDQDLLLVNSSDWTWSDPSDRRKSSALYRNDDGQFIDVTEGSGLEHPMYAMGAAVGDYDNDGLVDIFLTTVGRNHLYRNLGDSRFEETTELAGVAGDEDEWSTSAGWFDYDNDGDLDLFVCNYVRWNRDYDRSQDFQLVGGGRAYGRPQNFEGTFPYLYRNEGEGRFVDVSETAGIQIRNPATGVPLAKSLGVSFCDFDADGFMDIAVANDTVQNLLLRNLSAGPNTQGQFADVGTLTGIAFDQMGNARGAMGIDVASIRGRRSLAVAIGNFSNEMTALYVTPAGKIQFYDEAVSTGLGPNTRLALTFGLFYFDYDLDGRQDLFCANGHLEEEINRVQPSQFYAQPPQVFWNAGPQHETEFIPVGEDSVGQDLVQPMVGRGAAYADYDNDGDLDVLLTSVGQRPRLLRNDQQLNHAWLKIKLSGDGEACSRDAIGSWVEVTVGTKTQRKQVMPTKSYLSQSELPLTFGFGQVSGEAEVVVHWSDGQVDQPRAVPLNQFHRIERE